MQLLRIVPLWFLSFICLCGTSQSSLSSDTIVIEGALLLKDTINEKIKYFVDTTGRIDVGTARREIRSLKSITKNEFRWPTTPDSVQYAYWFSTLIRHNNDLEVGKYFLYFGKIDSVEIWVYQNQHLILKSSNGFLVKKLLANTSPTNNVPASPYSLPIKLENEQTYEVLVRIRNTISFPEKTPYFEIRSAQYESFIMDSAQWPFFVINGGFGAILIFVLLLSLYQFFKSSERAHLYYAGYLFSLLLFFGYRLEKSALIPGVFSNFPDWYYLFEIPISGGIIIFYVLFIHQFLREKQEYFRAFYDYFNLVIGGISLYILFFLAVGLFFGHFEFWKLFYASRYIRLLIASLFFIYFTYKALLLFKLLKLRFQYINLFLIGTLLLIAFGGVLTIIFYFWSDKYFAGVWQLPLLPIQVGIIAEIFFYNLALSYREQVIVKENIQIKLDNLVNLLKPHFITNALNNPEDLIYYDQKKASHYIFLLSSLFKDVIVNSQNHLISLDKELKILENYLKIQQVRFPERFNFSIQVDPNVDPSSIFIPPMVLQPHTENAIKYAFNKPLFKGEGLISIHVKHNNGSIVCSIDDNGIGRIAASNMYTSKGTGKGIRTTEEIIVNTNRINKTNLTFRITDKYNLETQQAEGTVVELIIPA